MLKACIPAYTLLLQFLHLVQIHAKWIHSYQMPFGSIKMGFVKINVLCSPFERTQSRTIELGFSWEINAFDICTVRFSQKPFGRNSIYCSFHLNQKACSPFLQCIYALRVYLCAI